MGEYFKPLRRKIGVLTLLLACVFAGLWIRSCRTFDFVCIPGKGTNYVLLSGVKKWLVLNHKSVRTLTSPGEVTIHISPDGSRSKYMWDTVPVEKIIVEWEYADGSQQLIDMNSYAVIVIPLTLLSAWLLLSKPRILTSGKS